MMLLIMLKIGDVQGLTATQLGSSAIKASVERAGVEPDQVEE